MLNLTCIICDELFAKSDEVYVTSCGHMFHHSCLIQWLERSKSCPLCRYKCTTSNIIRVYFNLANLDESRNVVDSLQKQLANANLAIKVKERECHKVETQMVDLKDTQKKCLKTIAELEEKLQNCDLLISSQVALINVLKNVPIVVDRLREEQKTFKQQREAFLTAFASYKDRRKEHDSKRKLEEPNSHLKSYFDQASEKPKSLKTQTIDVDASSSSLGLNTNRVSLKFEEHGYTIAPATKLNTKRIEESTSPYPKIKSSSVGVAHHLKAPYQGVTAITPRGMADVKRKTFGDLGEGYPIPKKPRLMLDASSSSGAAAMSTNVAYNGMGVSKDIGSICTARMEGSRCRRSGKKPTAGHQHCQ